MPAPDSFDVVVLGLGAMGSAALSALARRGAEVLGIERHDVPTGEGSSGGQSRLIRKAYYEHPDYVPLLEHAFAGWQRLEARTGATILLRTGLIEMGRAGGGLVTGVLRAAREHGLSIEQVGRAEVPRRFPGLVVPSGHEVLFEADAGLLLCERAVAAFAEDALHHGAQIRAREQVRSFDVEDASIRISTDKGRILCNRLVSTAGAWTGDLLAGLRLPLRVTRQAMCWFATTPPDRFALGRFPCFAIEDEDPEGGLFYGFPSLPIGVADGPRGVKAAIHRLGESTSPDIVDRTLRDVDEAAIRRALRRHLPAADGPLLAARVCLYTNSPDGHFVIDRHPHDPRIALACGFSGHGFKFAPVVGEALADLALHGATALPIGFLGLRRFG